MRAVRYGIRQRSPHHAIISEVQRRIVVGIKDAVHVVAIVTSDSFDGLWKGRKIPPVDGAAGLNGHWSVAVDAKLADLSLILSPGVHRNEERVIGRVGVHAGRPIRVMSRVARLTCLGIHELFFGVMDRGLGRRAAGQGQDQEHQGVVFPPRRAGPHAIANGPTQGLSVERIAATHGEAVYDGVLRGPVRGRRRRDGDEGLLCPPRALRSPTGRRAH